MNFACKNCEHSVKVDQNGNSGFTCHRNPPIPIPLMGRDMLGQPAMQIIAAWPPVPETEFCGEWEERTTALGELIP